MEALRRLTKQIAGRDDSARSHTETPENRSPVLIQFWRSFVLRVFAVFNAAMWYQVVQMIQRRVETLAVTQEVKSISSTGKKKKRPSETKGQTIMAAGRGKALPKSTGKHMNHNPATCPHDMMTTRANAHTTWWSCTRCGSRWERTDSALMQRQPAETLEEANTVPKHDEP